MKFCQNHSSLPQQSCFFTEDMQTIRTTFSQLLNEDSMKHIDYKTFNSIQVPIPLGWTLKLAFVGW
jgi:hypothetical protein